MINFCFFLYYSLRAVEAHSTLASSAGRASGMDRYCRFLYRLHHPSRFPQSNMTTSNQIFAIIISSVSKKDGALFPFITTFRYLLIKLDNQNEGGQ
jgi:hypothetical protein